MSNVTIDRGNSQRRFDFGINLVNNRLEMKRKVLYLFPSKEICDSSLSAE